MMNDSLEVSQIHMI